MTDITFEYLTRNLPARPDDAHKGTMGTLCSITGSYGFSGAAVLSAKAALRSGVGLHYQVIPEPVYPVFASSVYESVCVPVRGNSLGTVAPTDSDAILNTLSRATAVLIGCGMGNTSATAEVLRTVVKNSEVPVVIDADGINALSQHMNILNEQNAPLILTPHIKEFSRLSGLDVPDIIEHQSKVAEEFSLAHPDTVLVLKSHRTVIAENGVLYRNTAGNSGMAKGGSGDVLAGIIASLAAQGAAPFEAAIMGVHIHALAGDLAAVKHGRTSMLPSDIIDNLGEIFKRIEAAR
ncbi:MAG: NAD(P)H-hydrate dehydratase [Ruminococcus sp.]|nr:NAD(P)H-hydrate dehydratase [Ruminococcus sp.]